jgi:penicillin-binding protein 2
MTTPFSPRRDGDSRKRARFLSVVITAVLSFYLFYLFDLQVVNGSIYKARAKEVAQRTVDIPAQRGEIFDRNYDKPLVTNSPSFAVDIIPAEAGRFGMTKLIVKLATLLHIPAGDIRARLPIGWRDVYRPVEIQAGVPFSTISYIAEHLSDYPGVSWHSKPIRDYVADGSISHILGYVGDITLQELQVLYNKGYTANSTVGKSGIEKEYDNLLRGRDGKQFRVVDANGRRIPDTRVADIPPVDGKNLVLTIDRHIQVLAEKALGPRMGSVVVMRPSTGGILAMVSYPWYNPNLFERQGGSEQLRKVFLDPRFPFINRAIQSVYAPASTFKIIMTTADYATKVLPPDKKIDTTGSMVYGGRVWHDWQPHGFGPIDLAQGLAHSSDQYFWTLGAQYLGVERIDKFAKIFGLGEMTGIDLPGEVAGLVPTPQWKEQTYGRPWVGGDTMNISIGQGHLQVTPIQMADVAAMVVNKGVIYKPHVLKEVRDSVTGKILRTVQPQVLHDSGISKQIFTKVQKAMRGVVTFGSAGVVITEKAVKIAAKTGTGQVGRKDHFTSWFVSFGPYDAKDPADQIVVVVMVEATNPWEWWAPKAADIIYQGIFAHQNFQQAVRALEPVWYLNSSVVGSFDR